MNRLFKNFLKYFLQCTEKVHKVTPMNKNSAILLSNVVVLLGTALRVVG